MSLYKIGLHSAISQLNHVSLRMWPRSFITQLISHSAPLPFLLISAHLLPPLIQLVKVLEPAVKLEQSTEKIWRLQRLQARSSWASEKLKGQEEDPQVPWCVTTNQRSNTPCWFSSSGRVTLVC